MFRVPVHFLIQLEVSESLNVVCVSGRLNEFQLKVSVERSPEYSPQVDASDQNNNCLIKTEVL